MPGIIGPIESYPLPEGGMAPLYVLKFDKDGICTTPRSRARLLQEIEAGQYTDVYLFSHGWNNTPKNAIKHYKTWVKGFTELRESLDINIGRPYRPVLIGVVWPSVWIVPWWNRGPNIAASPSEDGSDESADAYDAMLRALAAELPANHRAQFYAYAQEDALDDQASIDLLQLLQPVFGQADDELNEPSPSTDVLLESWGAVDALIAGDADEFVPIDFDTPVGTDTQDTSTEAEAPQAAGGIARAPLSLIRMASVWQMKDRAGRVGSGEISALLQAVQSASTADTIRTHLVGHSFGAKVMLSALTARPLARPIDSMLLLQPAINHWAFAEHIPDIDRAGGYHPALDRVRQPILTTFTRKDAPLHKFFHLALRRKVDYGELRIASRDVSPYAALGGYGPTGAPHSSEVPIAAPGSAYRFGSDDEIIALEAHEEIEGHSDINKPVTYWALLELVRQS
ncbi:MAG: hypothetical protein AAGG11_23325 [Pseudomonadota bacterium]